MVGRYQIKRGVSLSAQPDRVQRGVRVDTRKHTRHCLRPPERLVRALLAMPPRERAAGWTAFERAYTEVLEQRFAEDRSPFDALRELATDRDVFVGCNCPTANNPDLQHCDTVAALRFMQRMFPELRVELP